MEHIHEIKRMKFRMINKKRKYISLISIVLLLCLFMLFFYKTLYLSGASLRGDTLFHAQRILEIRYAFQHHELPNWLNFHTFMGVGQAINGMYPDITLWPFVFVTNFLSAAHQVVIINLLILSTTLLVTTISLKNNCELDWETSFYTGIAYSFSGYVLYQFAEETQPGTGVILIFSSPIFFSLKRIFDNKKIDIRLAIEFAMCITLIMYSHLLSIVVFGIMLVGVFIYRLIRRSTLKYAFVNMFIGGLLSIITTLPIFYRYFSISKSGIVKPFGQGNIQADSIFAFINKAGDWSSRDSLSMLSLVCLLIVMVFILKSNYEQIMPLMIFECWLCLMCTSIVPWRFLNKVPFVNNLQFTPWRFGIWTSFLPLLMLLIVLGKREELRRKVIFILAVVSLFMTYQVIRNVNSAIYMRLNMQNVNTITRMKTNYNKKDKSLLQWVPKIDYYPNVKNVKDKNENMSKTRKADLFNPKIKMGSRSYSISRRDINNGVTIVPKSHVRNGKKNLQLPVIGYKNLKYAVSVNGKPVKYHINQLGYITINSKQNFERGDQIKIIFTNPVIYDVLLGLSFSFLIIYFWILVFTSKRKRIFVATN